MGGFGLGVNRFIAAHKTNLRAAPTAPEAAQTLLTLPGTVYLAQKGSLYAMSNGHFSALHLPSTDSKGNAVTWEQPTVLPNGNLVAVMRGAEYSDLYEVTTTGQ